MPTIVDSLIVTLGLDASNFKKGASDVESDLFDLAKKTLVAVGAFKTLEKTVSNFINAGEEIGRFSNLNGIAVEQVQALDNATRISGGSVDSMRGTVAELNKQMRGLYPVNPFAIIGVRATDSHNRIKPMTTLLEEVAGRMEGMDKARQLDIGKKLGFDESTIFLLQKGRTELSKIFEEQKRLGILTREDTKISRAMNEAWVKMGIAFRTAAAPISRVLLPALTWIADKLTDLSIWVRRNEDFLKNFFISIGVIISTMLLPTMWSLAVATVAATWPLMLIGAAILFVSATIAALIDDYKVWKEGGKSAFNETWRVAERAFNGMMSAAKEFVDFMKPLFNGLSIFLQGVNNYVLGIFTGNFGKMTDATNEMVDGLKNIWEGYKDYLFDIMSGIVDYITDKMSFVPGLFKKIGSLFGGGDKGKAPGGLRPSAITNNSQMLTNSSNVNIGNITIQSNATNAKEMGMELVESIKRNGMLVNQAEGGMI